MICHIDLMNFLCDDSIISPSTSCRENPRSNVGGISDELRLAGKILIGQPHKPRWARTWGAAITGVIHAENALMGE